ncbi:MAG: hypothetical protein IJ725_04070 [Ruminococcus sp.]|nr:hypothetical protein [Ruminococcus sp.]
MNSINKENYDFCVNWCRERVEWLRDYYGIVPTITETIRLKKLKVKKQTVKPFVVKNAKGKVTYKIKSVSAKIKKSTK